MSLSTLPLSYCTNVHPGTTVAEVLKGLTTWTIPVRNQWNRRLAAGLWLPASVIAELETDPSLLQQLQQTLHDGRLVCYTLNAFPYGDFHEKRVKEQVYLPDWSDHRRTDYTRAAARMLARLMPPGVEGSISTLPLAFKPAVPAGSSRDSFLSACCYQLLNIAQELDQLHDETGQVIRLAIEPEPYCLLETTAETISFFQQLFATAESQGLAEIARRHLGVCYDVCHQAVEFEDIPASIESLDQEGIRINKVHLTCALHLNQPLHSAAAREQLADFAEPRYLHQTFARRADGSVVSEVDLTRGICESPPPSFQGSEAWRIHFHVPVNREQIGPLRTTRDELKQALTAVSQLTYAPHLEIETYTWGVLPEDQPSSLGDGLLSEITATQALLDEINQTGATIEAGSN